MRANLTRRLAGTAASSVLLAAAILASATGAQASPPNWVMDVVALPTSVAPGATAGFSVTITNNGPSNISSLYLVTKTTAPTLFVDDSNGRNACTDAGVPLNCAFGALNPLESVTVIVAFTSTGTGSYDPGFEGNTTGQAFTDPKRSHGDVLIDTDFTGTTLNGDKNFGGAFNITFGGLVSNNANLTGQNKQSTNVSNLPAAAGATVLDGSTATGSCTTDLGAGIDCSKLFGEWSDVSVGNGGPYPAPIIIQISFKSGTPNAFLHVFDGGGQQLVSQCAGNVAPTDVSQLPCFTWDGHNTATIYTLTNGSWKGL
jgi:uncharacterized protein DUF11